MAENSAGKLRIVYLGYDEKTPGYWYIRYAGSTQRFQAMKDMIKRLGRAGAMYGQMYMWHPKHECSPGIFGAWWVHRQILVSILNGFDNHKEMTEQFLVLEIEAALHFEKKRQAEIEAKRKEDETARQRKAKEDAENTADYFKQRKQRYGTGNFEWNTSYTRTSSPPNIPVAVKEALQVLALPISVSYEDAQRQYRELAQRYHTDKNVVSEESMKRINAARDTLYRWKGWIKSKPLQR
jgi:uncharacterized protein YueI